MLVKIAACVILYYPEQPVEQHIKSYINYVEKIYLVDNSTTKTNLHLSDYQSKINFIHDGKNEGVAKRLNQACDLAIKDGFEYLLTMDQDSFFEDSQITSYLNCIDKFSNKGKIAMFGVNHKHQTKEKDGNYKNVRFLITSGSIINLLAYKKAGPFDENLFIDFVDTEYCFRSIKKGYEIIEFPNIFMHHSLGTSAKHRSLKNLKKTTRSFHPPIRLYYMVRNFFYINALYKEDFKKELKINKTDLVHRIKNNLLYKKSRMQTLKLIFKGWKDFKQNKMGKISV